MTKFEEKYDEKFLEHFAQETEAPIKQSPNYLRYKEEYEKYKDRLGDITLDNYIIIKACGKNFTKTNACAQIQKEIFEDAKLSITWEPSEPKIQGVKRFDGLIEKNNTTWLLFMKATDANPNSKTTGGGNQDNVLNELETTINAISSYNNKTYSYMFVLEGRFWNLDKCLEKIEEFKKLLEKNKITYFFDSTVECAEFLKKSDDCCLEEHLFK